MANYEEAQRTVALQAEVATRAFDHDPMASPLRPAALGRESRRQFAAQERTLVAVSLRSGNYRLARPALKQRVASSKSSLLAPASS